MTVLAKIGAGVAGAAVAGFGLSAGRSAWKKGSKNVLPILAAIFVVSTFVGAIAFPVYGGREIARGHDRGPLASMFMTILAPLSCLVLGFAAAMLADQWIQGFQGIEFQEGAYRYSYIAAVTGASFLLGLLWGLAERGGRKRSFALVAHNEQFLRVHEIRETNEPNVTHVDANGNRLRFVDRSSDRLTFLAVGRRNKRAYISLSPSGKMLAYSGVLGINQVWNGEDIEDQDLSIGPSHTPLSLSQIKSLFSDGNSLHQLIEKSRELAELYDTSDTEEIREVLLELSDHHGWLLFRYLDDEASDLDAVAALIALSIAAFPNFQGSREDRLSLIKRDLLPSVRK